jgi:glycine/D-amino acid oxidase-like deaminating enzyme
MPENIDNTDRKKICIIGAGWYGCHLALALRKLGYDVTLYEKNHQIFSGVSGSFGIRLHSGLHYPRSEKTREHCRKGFYLFKQHYSELIIELEQALYALGTTDADGLPSKINKEQFLKVVEELNGYIDWEEIDPKSHHFQELQTLINLKEPSVILGKPLRNAFTKYLADAGVNVVCDYEVTQIEKNPNETFTVHGKDVQDEESSEQFDKVINATGYQAHIPENETDFPFDMEIAYQPCLALVYEDTQAKEKPFSLIVMEGWFPCIAPVCDHEGDNSKSRDYILTHGKWTIIGSYANPEKAKIALSQLDDEFVEKNIKTPSECEMKRFWPEFTERFRYKGWRGEVLAKLKTRTEFRSGFTYQKDGVIHVFPGKISNVFDAENEVLALLKRENVLTENGYSFVQGGVLDDSRMEVQQIPHADEISTTNLQTFVKLIDEHAQCAAKFYPQRPSPLPGAIFDPRANYFFELQCLNRFFAGAALLGAAVVTLIYISALAAIPIAASAIIMMGYSTYGFFSQNNRTRTDTIEQTADFEDIIPGPVLQIPTPVLTTR